MRDAPTAMKLDDLSHDWRVLLGLALIVLGAGNWAVGRHRTRQYSSLLAAEPISAADQSYRSFDELDSSASAVLEPFTSEQRRVSYTMARMDFYHAAFLTGEVMIVAGLLVTCIGFLALIRRDAARAHSRISVRTLGHGPPL